MSGPEGIDALVKEAEEYLLLSRYREAEDASLEVLRRTVYIPGSELAEDRAASVLLQALYETDRFSTARKQLQDSFGRLSSTPPSALLLYLSLSLDFQASRGETQTLTLELLQSKAPGPGAWPRRHFLSLLHLYLFDVLLPTCSEPAQAARWLETSPLPVSAEDRAALLDELDAALAETPSAGLEYSGGGRRRTRGGGVCLPLEGSGLAGTRGRGASASRLLTAASSSDIGDLGDLGASGSISASQLISAGIDPSLRPSRAGGGAFGGSPPRSAARPRSGPDVLRARHGSTGAATQLPGGLLDAWHVEAGTPHLDWLSWAWEGTAGAVSALKAGVLGRVRGEGEGRRGGAEAAPHEPAEPSEAAAPAGDASADAAGPLVAGALLLVIAAVALGPRAARSKLVTAKDAVTRGVWDVVRMALQMAPASVARG